MNIIGVDHIQFAYPDVIASAGDLTRFGYELAFVEQDFNTETRSFFRGRIKTMAYLHRGASRVEVITSAGEAGHARFIATAADTPIFDGVIAPARRMRLSESWWRCLGFRQVASDRFMFPANMLSMPLTIRLDRDAPEDDADAMADDFGCSSIALITRDLTADRLEMTQAGYAVSETTLFHIHKRNVTVCFVSGPSGELVELVEFGRT